MNTEKARTKKSKFAIFSVIARFFWLFRKPCIHCGSRDREIKGYVFDGANNYVENNPNWDKMPDIRVTWTWNTKEQYEKMGGHPRSFGQSHDYYDKLAYPQICTRDWGYIDCPKEEAVKRFADYAGFHKYADNVKVFYNGEKLFDGKYEA